MLGGISGAANTSNMRKIDIKPACELRCEISDDEELYVKMTVGTCELFGIELASGKEYYFKDANIALYTWYGCSIEISGIYSNDKIYESDKTPMVAYVNAHTQLEFRRDVALANSDNGPKVLIVGPNDHGKSSIARILSAYAVRLDRTPIYVDLDVGQGANGIPGTICASPIDKASVNIDDGLSLQMPLVYYHGHSSPQGNVELYKHLVSIMAAKVQARLDKDIDTKSSGVIINTSGWIDGGGFELLQYIIKAFAIDIILVMGFERLYSSLTNSMLGTNTTVVNLPISGGIVRRDAEVRRRIRKAKIREYFYGVLTKGKINVFTASRQDIRMNNIKIYRAGAQQLSEGMRLIGDSAVSSATTLNRVTPSQDLIHNILAVLHPSEDYDAASSNAMQHSNVAGYVWVISIDIDQDIMTVLSPCPGELPSKNLLMGTIKWIE